MAKKVVLVVPEAPTPSAKTIVDERRIERKGIRLGVLDNSKGNADHLLRFMVDSLKDSGVAVASVVTRRKPSVSLPAPPEILEELARDADVVVSAMAD